MPRRSWGIEQKWCVSLCTSLFEEETKGRADTSGQNSLRHRVSLMEKRLGRQGRFMKPRSNKRSKRGPLGKAPDCSHLYVGNCKLFIKVD